MKCFIFPLTHSNLFPLTTKPLNIFEPRYLQMIEDSIRTKTPIALAYVPENGDTYRSIAGFGMPQIIDQRPNSTVLIFLQGQGKLKIIKELNSSDVSDVNSTPYIIAECEMVNEDLELDEHLKKDYMVLSKVLISWVQKHISEPAQREMFVRSLSGTREVIGAIAAYLIRDYDLQYEMMEILNLNDQIKYLFRLFESGELTI